MTNQQKIYEFFIQNSDSLEKVFQYNAVYKIADEILEASDAGKYYATLKFLQKYCIPINCMPLQLDMFRNGDPRNYIDLNSVKNIWQFVLKINEESKDKGKGDPETIDSLRRATKIDIIKFPDYYQKYHWSGKHKLFGYPADSFPTFQWIKSLENRFDWLRKNSLKHNTSSQYLLKEMIEWGGSQNGLLQKFNDCSGEVNLFELIQSVITNLKSPEMAIKSSLKLPGFGLTYASKLLRFMEPHKYGALDSRIRKALLKRKILIKIYDGNLDSMVNGYLEFLKFLNRLKRELESQQIKKPDCELSTTGLWKPSEIEMALFCWAGQILEK